MANRSLSSDSTGTKCTSRSGTPLSQPDVHDLKGVPRVILLPDEASDFALARDSFAAIPQSVHLALEYWAFQGVPPSGWLQAILTSELYHAINFVPPAVMWQIPAIACMLRLYYPHDSYGSVSKVASWCAQDCIHMLETPRLTAYLNRPYEEKRAG